LQSLGFVIELRRIWVGDFKEEDSFYFDTSLPPLIVRELLEPRVLPIKTILKDFPVLEVGSDFLPKILNGNRVFLNQDFSDVSCCLIEHRKELLAIGKVENGLLIPIKVFAQ
jgi:tRNA U55 pseudouridine synthase TruB